jgi:DNA-binding transcriptional regulator/RsmH inhibitor MraZ
VAELLGTHSYQLDPKGRISLPARFRDAFADGAVLTLGQDGCLYCFPRAEWETRAVEVHGRPISDAEIEDHRRGRHRDQREALSNLPAERTVPSHALPLGASVPAR